MVEKEPIAIFKERRLAYKKITVDLDGVMVMAMVTALDWVNKRYGTNYVLQQINSWGALENSLQKDFGISKEEAFAVWLEPKVLLEAPPVSGSIRAIQALTMRGADITFVTARRSMLREVTLAWVERHMPNIKPQQVLMQPEPDRRGTPFKIETVKRLNPDLHVEDIPEIANMLDGINVVLVKQNWNLDAPNFIRKSWFEIYRMIVYGK